MYYNKFTFVHITVLKQISKHAKIPAGVWLLCQWVAGRRPSLRILKLHTWTHATPNNKHFGMQTNNPNSTTSELLNNKSYNKLYNTLACWNVVDLTFVVVLSVRPSVYHDPVPTQAQVTLHYINEFVERISKCL